MLRLVDGARAAFQRLPESWPLRLGLGGLLVGAISIHIPQVWGNGYSVVEQLLLRPSTAWLLAQLLVLKAVATSMTRGSGAVGGMLTPTILMGAALGQLLGLAGQAVGMIPAGLTAGYAAIGMGALLSGTTQAPLMAILMVSEMTGQQNLTLPLAIACICAHLTVKALHSRSIYDQAIRVGS
jgi:CIC family chloride channel protein